jgi:sugar lactone lactonase YvrE
MKTTLLSFGVLLAFVIPLKAQFTTNQAADRVIGAPDFDTAGSQAEDASGLNTPNGVAIDPSTQKLFVASTGQNRVLRYASSTALANGAAAEAVFGQDDLTSTAGGTAANRLNSPYGIHVDAQGRLWIADMENDRVLMFEDAATRTNGANADLVLGQTNFTNKVSGDSAATMDNPVSVFVDANDNLWVAEYLNNRVTKFVSASTLANGASASVVVGQAGFGSSGGGDGDTRMNYPGGVFVDSSDTLWVVEQGNDRVIRFANASTLTNGAAASGVLGQENFMVGPRTTAADRFSSPTALLVEPGGTLWVLDYDNNRALAFFNAAAKANGADADLVLGQPDFVSSGSGTSDRYLNGPGFGIARDAQGRLWIPERLNHRVLRFSPAGITPPADTTKPLLTVKTRPAPFTLLARYPFTGTASDNAGIKEVRYRVGNGPSLKAKGTTSWSFRASLPKRKRTTIRIHAEDLSGNRSAVKTFRITRI